MIDSVAFFKTKNGRRTMIVVIIVVVLCFGIARSILSLFDPVSLTTDGVGWVRVTIPRGMGMRDITTLLYEQGLIRSPRAVQFYGLITGKAHALQAGVYFLNPAMSSYEIIQKLERGDVGKSVTIIEGATLRDIDALLANEGLIVAGDLITLDWNFLKDDFPFLARRTSLEGYLFPDTYIFSFDDGARGIARKMVANFSAKTLRAFPDMTYSQLILASIIEKEVRTADDRALVAGLLLKRLDAGRGLDVDATLVYMKCEKTFVTCVNRAVGSLDKEVRSPYNTYLYEGLPPTPIGNPGEHAIFAALHPEESPYWYYLSAKNTGETIFSRTLDEHNTNRLQYL